MNEQILAEVERLIGALIADVGLRLEAPLEPRTSFSELGLQSLHLMELGFRLAEAFQIELSHLEDPAAFESIEALSRTIDAAVRER